MAGRDGAQDVQERVARSRTLGRSIERLSDDEIRRLSTDSSPGWGVTNRVEVAGLTAFIKRVPVTGVERAAGLPTSNAYDIPPFLNYPFGSPGMAVGRELQFALRATAWVEDGSCAAFPILVHHRLVDRIAHEAREATIDGYTAYKGDDAAMNRYLADRAAAPCDLILCYEHIPHTAADWIIDHPSDAARILDDVRATIGFLRAHGVVHFDTDLFNVLTDGRHAYVADYGLVMDETCDLNHAERQFFARNVRFDDGNLILSMGHQLYWMYRAAPDDLRDRIGDELDLIGASFEEAVRRLLDAVDDLDDRGLFRVGTPMRSLLHAHRPVIDLMHSFFAAARADWSADIEIDGATLARLLDA